jgi:CHASE2 domain-containing sensor protein
MFVVAFAVFGQYHGLTDSIDRRVQDMFVRLSPGASGSHFGEYASSANVPDVAVIAVDPRSLRSFNDWPWPRSRHAEAIDRLDAAGARAIAFDIDFSSPSDFIEDALFADAIQRYGSVVLASFSQFQELGEGAEIEIANTPIPELKNSAAGLGSVLVPIDPDGVVRHVPRLSLIRGEAVPSLARAAMVVAFDLEKSSRDSDMASAGRSTWVDFRRVLPEIPTLSYIDLLEGKIDKSLLEDRVVFVGATAAEFQDLWATPIAPALPGVLIQAVAYRTAVAEMLGERVVEAAPLHWVFGGYVVLGLLLLPRSKMNRFLRLGMFTLTSVAVVVLAWWSLWQFGVLVPTGMAFILVAAQYTLGIESLQKRIEERAAAQESSLSVLARLGESTPVDALDSSGAHQSPSTAGLELALELLGEVVDARGAIMMSATPQGSLATDRLEWRPTKIEGEDLVVDMEVAEASLAKRKLREVMDPSSSRSPIVYTPLVAGSDPVGVLVVFCSPGHTMDALTRRTIATVGAQMALTAQNLKLIDQLRQTFESLHFRPSWAHAWVCPKTRSAPCSSAPCSTMSAR